MTIAQLADHFRQRELTPNNTWKSYATSYAYEGGFFFTYYPTASSASATMASSAIATDKKNWNAAANSWEWPLPIKPLWLQNPRTTATGTSN